MADLRIRGVHPVPQYVSVVSLRAAKALSSFVLEFVAPHILALLTSLYPPSGKRRYNIKLWKTFTDCFNCLPIAAIIDEKIFCVHGTFSISYNLTVSCLCACVHGTCTISLEYSRPFGTLSAPFVHSFATSFSLSNVFLPGPN
jgi:hypothetical protein